MKSMSKRALQTLPEQVHGSQLRPFPLLPHGREQASQELRLQQRPSRLRLSDRQKTFVFVKMLLQYLDRANIHLMQVQAKAIIAECVQRNRMGDPLYADLQNALQVHLSAVLGYTTYTRIQLCCQRRYRNCSI